MGSFAQIPTYLVEYCTPARFPLSFFADVGISLSLAAPREFAPHSILRGGTAHDPAVYEKFTLRRNARFWLTHREAGINFMYTA